MTLATNTTIRHVKRQTTYRVIALADCVIQMPYDGQSAYLGMDREGLRIDARPLDTLVLPLVLQISIRPLWPAMRFTVYQSLDDHRIWARPLNEFTPDRFEVLA